MTGLVVIVVTYNSADAVESLLASLPSGLDGVPAQVVVVDNGSSDTTTEVVARHPDVVLVRETNRGYAAGINRGLAEAPNATHFLVLNPDLVILPGAIAPLMDALAMPGVGIAAPRVIGPDGTLQHSLRREPTLARALGLGATGKRLFSEYVLDEAAYRSPHDVDWALGAALMLSAECLEAVGGWDESYFLYSEETDFCLRARDLGWRTRYVPSSTVMHAAGGSGRTDATHSMQIVNRVRLFARLHSAPSAWAYWGLTILSELSWILRGHPQSRAAFRALVSPRSRPLELGCGGALLPR